jgi:hypothetical protein
MTYMSLRILRFPDAFDAASWENASVNAETVKDLDLLARKAGPYKVRDWARAVDLPQAYVDNCWIRVPVTPDQLRRFNEEVLDGAATLGGLIDPHQAAVGTLAIESEEF